MKIVKIYHVLLPTSMPARVININHHSIKTGNRSSRDPFNKVLVNQWVTLFFLSSRNSTNPIDLSTYLSNSTCKLMLRRVLMVEIMQKSMRLHRRLHRRWLDIKVNSMYNGVTTMEHSKAIIKTVIIIRVIKITVLISTALRIKLSIRIRKLYKLTCINIKYNKNINLWTFLSLRISIAIIINTIVIIHKINISQDLSITKQSHLIRSFLSNVTRMSLEAYIVDR